MRAFHCTWWAFFVAFFAWFAITPLLPEIKQDLGLTQQQIWTSSIAGVGSTIFVRFLLGPLCDKYGARILYLIILCSSAIPCGCTGLVNSAMGLVILRLFIGIAGGCRSTNSCLVHVTPSHYDTVVSLYLRFHFLSSAFVMCEYWSSVMFANEIVGTANGACCSDDEANGCTFVSAERISFCSICFSIVAIVAGWGNLGAGKYL